MQRYILFNFQKYKWNLDIHFVNCPLSCFKIVIKFLSHDWPWWVLLSPPVKMKKGGASCLTLWQLIQCHLLFFHLSCLLLDYCLRVYPFIYCLLEIRSSCSSVSCLYLHNSCKGCCNCVCIYTGHLELVGMGEFTRLINQGSFNPLNKTFRLTFKNSTLPTNNLYTLLIIITMYLEPSVLDQC